METVGLIFDYKSNSVSTDLYDYSLIQKRPSYSTRKKKKIRSFSQRVQDKVSSGESSRTLVKQQPESVKPVGVVMKLIKPQASNLVKQADEIEKQRKRIQTLTERIQVMAPKQTVKKVQKASLQEYELTNKKIAESLNHLERLLKPRKHHKHKGQVQFDLDYNYDTKKRPEGNKSQEDNTVSGISI